MPPPGILITGSRSPVALEWARRLGRAGNDVFAADSFRYPLCAGSRYVRRNFSVPPPRSERKAFGLAVAKISRDFEIDRVIPTCEEIFYLARYGNLLREGCSLFAASLETLHLLHHKARFAEFATALGHEIAAPETFGAAAGRSGEWVFKPVYSRFASRTLIKPVSRERLTNDVSWIAQRYVEGQEVSSYAIAVDGRVTAFAAYTSKYRNRARGGGAGAGIYFEPVGRPDLMSFTQRVAGALSFTGQIAFDFISARDRTWVIECNPRATSGLHLLEERDPASYLDGTARDVWTAAPQVKMLAAPMILAPHRRVRLRDFLNARDVLWAGDDPLPALLSFRTVFELYRLARKGRMSPTEASTCDLEWNGEEG